MQAAEQMVNRTLEVLGLGFMWAIYATFYGIAVFGLVFLAACLAMAAWDFAGMENWGWWPRLAVGYLATALLGCCWALLSKRWRQQPPPAVSSEYCPVCGEWEPAAEECSLCGAPAGARHEDHWTSPWASLAGLYLILASLGAMIVAGVGLMVYHQVLAMYVVMGPLVLLTALGWVRFGFNFWERWQHPQVFTCDQSWETGLYRWRANATLWADRRDPWVEGHGVWYRPAPMEYEPDRINQAEHEYWLLVLAALGDARVIHLEERWSCTWRAPMEPGAEAERTFERVLWFTVDTRMVADVPAHLKAVARSVEDRATGALPALIGAMEADPLLFERWHRTYEYLAPRAAALGLYQHPTYRALLAHSAEG